MQAEVAEDILAEAPSGSQVGERQVGLQERTQRQVAASAASEIHCSSGEPGGLVVGVLVVGFLDFQVQHEVLLAEPGGVEHLVGSAGVVHLDVPACRGCTSGAEEGGLARSANLAVGLEEAHARNVRKGGCTVNTSAAQEDTGRAAAALAGLGGLAGLVRAVAATLDACWYGCMRDAASDSRKRAQKSSG